MGVVTSTTGVTIGVWGNCASPDGVAVLADNIEPGGVAIKARGTTTLEGELNVGLPAGASFRVDLADPGLSETAILVRRNVGGNITLQRVSMGGPDSAGAGFRVLRVPN